MKSFSVFPLERPPSDFSVILPSSKSIANRALILSALSSGTFRLNGDFFAEDIQLMVSALMKLGIDITREPTGLLISNDLTWMDNEYEIELFLGNSGTSIRFLSTLLCLRKGKTILTGNSRMKERPIGDLMDALRALGVSVQCLEQNGYPPFYIHSSSDLSSSTKIRGNISSQYLSSLLLSSVSFPDGMNIIVDGKLISRSYVDLTLHVMKEWGINASNIYDRFIIPHQPIHIHDYKVEGDASAAVYWWAFAYLHDCSVSFSNLSSSSVQGDCRFQHLLNSFDKNISSADDTIYHIDMNDMPDASLMLMALAPTCDRPIRITGIGSLRVKETDRISAMSTELKKLGVVLSTGEDWMHIEPGFSQISQNEQSVQIDTYDDHRIAMSFAILASKIGNLDILDPECVKKSYPSFWDDLEHFTGIHIKKTL